MNISDASQRWSKLTCIKVSTWSFVSTLSMLAMLSECSNEVLNDSSRVRNSSALTNSCFRAATSSVNSSRSLAKSVVSFLICSIKRPIFKNYTYSSMRFVRALLDRVRNLIFESGLRQVIYGPGGGKGSLRQTFFPVEYSLTDLLSSLHSIQVSLSQASN